MSEFLMDAKNIGVNGKALDKVSDPQIYTFDTSGTYTMEKWSKGDLCKITASTTSQLTINKGFDTTELNYVWVKNSSPVIQHVIRSAQTFWASPGQKVKFYLDGTTLVWASGGWELRYIDWSNTATVPPSSILRPTDLIGLYEVVYSNSTSFGRGIVSPLRIQDTGELAQGPTFSAATTIRPTWEPSGPYFYTQDSGYDIKELRFWHNPA
jgi:hypothetical protein